MPRDVCGVEGPSRAIAHSIGFAPTSGVSRTLAWRHPGFGAARGVPARPRWKPAPRPRFGTRQLNASDEHARRVIWPVKCPNSPEFY